MSGDARELNARPQALFGEHVTVANTTCLHFDPHMSRLRLRDLALNDLEICSGTGNLRYFHRCYCNCCRCHKFSYEFSATVESFCRDVLPSTASRARQFPKLLESMTSRNLIH